MKSIRSFALIISLMMIVMPLAACGGDKPTPNTLPAPVDMPQPVADSDTGLAIMPVAFKPADQLSPDISKSLTSFSLDLFQRLETQDAGKNVFISPLSVWLALGMTYNGASGTTAQGMAEALHTAGISIDDLNKANSGLMGVLQAADPNVKIAIANSIWVSKEYESAFNKSFLDTDRQYYGAQIKALNFGDAGTVDAINGWVEQNTNGNIKKLIDPPIDPQSVMFLINAVHFKAPWKVSFDPKKSFDGQFTTGDGKQVQAKFLSNKDGNFGFADESVTAARIPYSTGRLEMVAIMPKQQSIGDFVKGLTPEALQKYIDQCGETSMSLQFPKFKLEYAAKLNDALKAMGMEEAFASADFTNMSDSLGDKLVISEVKHKSFVEVNEEGTEASAATSVEMELTAVMTENLNFSKPFIYLIRDTKTGAILFIGTMENPA